MSTTAISTAVNGKDDIHFVAIGDDIEKCSRQQSDAKSDEDSSVKSNNTKRSDNTLDRSLRSLAHFKQSFRPFSTPKKIAEKKIIADNKDKNDPAKFLGDGVTFKAKLIGILEVDNARGDRMCQEALNELKMAVRAAGEHKLRINIVISIEGLRLRDEKTGDCLYHHPVHKISFIAQDVADSRAFGYIYGSPDMGHKFFGIKTDKSASQVVIAMRDLFQVVYELKKREVELAKHNIEQHQLKYGSNYFLDTISAASSKSGGNESVGKTKVTKEDTTIGKGGKNKNQTAGVIADLMDLELELNSLQQGLSQMERITPSDPFGPTSTTSAPSKEDPFGDSFTISSYTLTGTPPPTKIPPPPTSGDKRKTTTSTSSNVLSSELHWFDKETQNLFENDVFSSTVPSSNVEKLTLNDDQQHRTIENSYKLSNDLFDIFTELDPLGTGKSKPYIDKKDFFQELKNPAKKPLKDLTGNDEGGTTDGVVTNDDGVPIQNNLTTDHHPTCRIVGFRASDDDDHVKYNIMSEPFRKANLSSSSSCHVANVRSVNSDTLRKSPLVQSDSSSSQGSIHGLLKSSSSVAVPLFSGVDNVKIKNNRLVNEEDDDSGGGMVNERVSSENNDSFHQVQRHQQWSRIANNHVRQKIVINLRKVLSTGDDTDKENDSPVAEEAPVLKNSDATVSPMRVAPSSPDSFESIPEPPPRPSMTVVSGDSPATVTSVTQPPPPLPPKKVHVPVTLKPPPRPPSSSETGSHYDYIENYESSPSFRGSNGNRPDEDTKIPPIPAPVRKSRFSSYDSDLDTARKRPPPQRLVSSSSSPEYYLTPIVKNSSSNDIKQQTANRNSNNDAFTTTRKGKMTPPMDMTLKQLTTADLNDIADLLGIDPNILSKMTLKDLAAAASKSPAVNDKRQKTQSNQKFPAFEANFDKEFPTTDKNPSDNNSNNNNRNTDSTTVDKYAVFRELIEQEEMKQNRSNLSPHPNFAVDNSDNENRSISDKNENNSDRYAALRVIVENENDENISSLRDTVIRPSSVDSARSEGPELTSETKVDSVDVFARDRTPQDVPSTFAVTNTSDVQSAEQLPQNNIGKDWAKFDTFEELTTSQKQQQEKSVISPWATSSETVEKEFYGPVDTTFDECCKTKPRRSTERKTFVCEHWDIDDDEDDNEYYETAYGGARYNDDFDDDYYGDDSEDNLESSKKSLASSWDESSWKDNAWSDRDSLYGETTPSPTYREQHRGYQMKKKGYQRKFAPHYHKKLPEKAGFEVLRKEGKRRFHRHSDNNATNNNSSHPAKNYAVPPAIVYNVTTPNLVPWCDDGATYEKTTIPPQRVYDEHSLEYDTPTPDDELKVLKLVLGEKRLKQLSDRLYSQYSQKDHAKSSLSPGTYYDYPRADIGTPPNETLENLNLENRTGPAAKYLRKLKNQQLARKKYGYYAMMQMQQPGKTGRWDEDEGIGSPENVYPYHRRYSQDELTVSEEDESGCWPPIADQTLPPYYNTAPITVIASPVKNRTRSNQTSAFEDNFSLKQCDKSGNAVAPTMESSSLEKGVYYKSGAKGTCSRSRYVAPKLSPCPLLKQSKDQYKQQIIPYYNVINVGGSPELKMKDRFSRDSSQRPCPFQNDFASISRQRSSDRSVSSDLVVKEDVVRDAHHSSSFSDPICKSSSRRHYNRDNNNNDEPFSYVRGSGNRCEFRKHYENLVVHRRQTRDDLCSNNVPISGKQTARYKTRAAFQTYADSRRKINEPRADRSGVSGSVGSQVITSPMKCSTVDNTVYGDSRQYDPFNDKTGDVASVDSGGQQKSKSKTTKKSFPHSSGESAEIPIVDDTTVPVSWREDFSSFDFSDHTK